MELCLETSDQPAQSLSVRTRGQTNTGNIVVTVCYRPLDWEGVDEAFFGQLEELQEFQQESH